MNSDSDDDASRGVEYQIRTASPARAGGIRRPSRPSDRLDLPPGYEFITELGSGGMGTVYQVHNSALQRSEALKIINEYACASDIQKRRLAKEARALSRLDHPAIPPIYHFGEYRNYCYFTMACLSGDTLAAVLKSCGRLAVPRALEILLVVLDALAVVHETCKYMLAELEKYLAAYLPLNCEVALANSAEQTVPVYTCSFRLGRGADNSHVVVDETVSSHHACLIWNKDQFYLEDCRSKNGTYLLRNGREKQLKPGRRELIEGGNRFRLGKQPDAPLFTFLVEGQTMAM